MAPDFFLSVESLNDPYSQYESGSTKLLMSNQNYHKRLGCRKIIWTKNFTYRAKSGSERFSKYSRTSSVFSLVNSSPHSPLRIMETLCRFSLYSSSAVLNLNTSSHFISRSETYNSDILKNLSSHNLCAH